MLLPLPRATGDLPGLSGVPVLGERSCEEVLIKRPGQTGDHLWLKVAKTGLGTQQVRAALARSVGISAEVVACAGHRDRVGRCVQWFSIPKKEVDNPGPLRRAGAHGKMQVLELTASHKPVSPELVERLRWSVLLRGGAQADGYQRARRIMDRLRQDGCPNYLPPERFGPAGVLVKWGRLLVAGRRLPAAVTAAGNDAGRCLRALQEWLFNRYLATRVSAGDLAICLAGEVLRGSTGAISVVEDPAHGQRRLASWEAVAMGPLYGRGLLPAGGEAREREAAVLSEAGLGEAAVQRLPGDRRPIRVQPTGVAIDPHGSDLSVSCELPIATYVSVLLAEFIRDEPVPSMGEGPEPQYDHGDGHPPEDSLVQDGKG